MTIFFSWPDIAIALGITALLYWLLKSDKPAIQKNPEWNSDYRQSWNQPSQKEEKSISGWWYVFGFIALMWLVMFSVTRIADAMFASDQSSTISAPAETLSIPASSSSGRIIVTTAYRASDSGEMEVAMFVEYSEQSSFDPSDDITVESVRSMTSTTPANISIYINETGEVISLDQGHMFYSTTLTSINPSMLIDYSCTTHVTKLLTPDNQDGYKIITCDPK